MRSIIPDLPVLAVLVILFLYSRSHRSGASVFHMIFRELLAVSILGVILEIAVFSAENGHLSTTSFRILYTFYCASKPLLFALRVCYGIFRCYAPDMQPITRQTRHTFLFYGQFLLLVMTNKLTGLLFVIDDNRVITRGMLYLPLLLGVPLVFSVYGLVLTWMHAEHNLTATEQAGLAALYLLPPAGVILQLFCRNWPFISIAEVLAYVLFLYTLNISVTSKGEAE